MDQIMQLGSVGIGGTILIGILAGWLAEKLNEAETGGHYGRLWNHHVDHHRRHCRMDR